MRWIVTVLALFATVHLSVIASAQSLVSEDQQPQHQPFRIVVMPTLRMSDDSTTVPTTEMAESVAAELESWIARYPRAELVPWNELLASQTSAEALTLEQLRLGRRLYRAGDLDSAEEELAEAMQTASVSLLPWQEQRAMIESYESLFLLQLERASTAAEGAAFRQRENLARNAMRNLLRLDPAFFVDPARFPERIVELFQLERETASDELLVARPYRPDALARIVDRARADVIVETVVVRRGSRVTGRVLISYGDPLAVEVDEAIVWQSPDNALDLGKEMAEFAIDSLEVAVVCLPPTPIPSLDETERRPLEVWLGAGYMAGVYISSPTRARFLNHGAAFRTLVQFHEYVGIQASLHVLSSAEDRFGDLLDRVSTVQAGLGPSFSYTTGRFRTFFEPAFSYTQVGRVRASEEFWCKVSNGRETVFDGSGRDCSENDITETAPQAYLGIQLDGGVGVRLAGPLWLMARLHSVLFLAPVEGRSVDFPLGGELGLGLQF